MSDWTWAPVGWFLPLVAIVILASIGLMAWGWGKGKWVSVPVLANVCVLYIALNQYTMAQDALIAEFANRGLWPPPVANFYLYVGALAFIPLLMSVVRAGLFIRQERRAA